jgi:hypothetical protein
MASTAENAEVASELVASNHDEAVLELVVARSNNNDEATSELVASNHDEATSELVASNHASESVAKLLGSCLEQTKITLPTLTTLCTNFVKHEKAMVTHSRLTIQQNIDIANQAQTYWKNLIANTIETNPDPVTQEQIVFGVAMLKLLQHTKQCKFY